MMNEEFLTRLKKIESSLKSALQNPSNKEWRELSFGKIDQCINDSHISVLTDPCSHLISSGGKRWRPLLLVLCAQMTAESKNKSDALEKAYHLAPLVEFAHTASLIHDDIEDSAETRRSLPCAHIAYGIDVAINAGSWLYFEATTVIKSLKATVEEKLALYELFLRELRLLHLGQAMDIKWHRTPELIPTQDEYTAMVRNKTGTLSRLAVKIGILAGGGSTHEAETAGKIAQDIGVGFQIIDDVVNITTGNPGKKRGDDIVEGKKSLPVLIHLQKNPNDIKILSEYFSQAAQSGISSPAVEKAISLLTQSGAVQSARQIGTNLVKEKSAQLANFFGIESPAGNLIKELFDSMLSKIS